jgi:hypothetical protein
MKLYRKLFLFPPWIIVVSLLIITLLDFLIPWMVLGDLTNVDLNHLASITMKSQIGFLVLAAGTYGYWRAARFNPILDDGHYRAFSVTPWQPGKPLLRGPATLVWQDGFALLLPTVIVALVDAQLCMLIPFSFCLVYGLTTAFTMFHAECPYSGYGFLFIVGLPALDLSDIWIQISACAALSSLSHFSIPNSLRNVIQNERHYSSESTEGDSDQYSLDERIRRSKSVSRLFLGWPLNRFPEEGLDDLQPIHKLMRPLLFSWFSFLLFLLIEQGEIGFVQESYYGFTGLLFVGILLASALRLCLYMGGYRSPISLAGRLFTGRFIIPGYDKIFIAPLSSIIIFFLSITTFTAASGRVAINPPLAMLLSLLALYWIGPRRDTWRLTGNHRITPGSRSHEYVKPI